MENFRDIVKIISVLVIFYEKQGVKIGIIPIIYISNNSNSKLKMFYHKKRELKKFRSQAKKILKGCSNCGFFFYFDCFKTKHHFYSLNIFRL